jgi:hypothetical protein
LWTEPSPRQGERNPTRHTEELVFHLLLACTPERLAKFCSVGQAISKLALADASCIGHQIDTAMTLRGVFRKAHFLSDRIEHYRLKFFSNKLRALMRYRRGGHWHAVLISCGHRTKVSPRESWALPRSLLQSSNVPSYYYSLNTPAYSCVSITAPDSSNTRMIAPCERE